MLGCSLSAALFHFIAIAVFAYKINTTAVMPGWLNTYCSTFFYQDWKLFVPPPPNNYKLVVTLPDGTNTDIFAELRHKHQQHRLAGNGFELLAFVNYIHHFEKSTSLQQGNVSKDPNFFLLQSACTNYINQTRQLHLKNSSLVLYVQPIGDFPPRSYFAY